MVLEQVMPVLVHIDISPVCITKYPALANRVAVGRESFLSSGAEPGCGLVHIGLDLTHHVGLDDECGRAVFLGYSGMALAPTQ